MTAAVAEQQITVLGAGVVGVSAALELLARGARVTLIDRKDPGRETSYGNAGIISRSSLMPLNNPGLWGNLPRLATNRTAALRYNPRFLMRNLGWATGFLERARATPFEETAASLDGLIRMSTDLHRHLMAEAGILDRLRETGWIFLYRSYKGYMGSETARRTFERFEVKTETLTREAIQDLEPALKPVYERAIWIRDSCSVDAPGEVVEAYARLFVDRGGKIEKGEVAGLAHADDGWRITTTDGKAIASDKVVVAMGAWSRTLLERQGLKCPMGFERGYHMHFDGAGAGNTRLTRPIYDTAGSFVLSPMAQGLRLTTGVELTDCEAAPNYAQVNMAEESARQAIDLGDRTDDTPWLGRRPTFPDSRPVIGAAPGRPGMYLAFGHQHIGFCTGPATGRLLADIMEDKPPQIPVGPFAPARYIH